MKNAFPDSVLTRRTRPQEPDLRSEYFRDQTKIIHSLPFRRLKHKTQVFFAPENDHICTRIEHVLHVATIAATVCRGLNSGGWSLDPDLAYAIGLGHDLGHAPFGHSGEMALCEKLGARRAFLHELNSYRVVEKVANEGRGLNLTFAVKDGIMCHNGENFEINLLSPSKEVNDLESITDRNHLPSTWEGCIVRMADKMAYLGRDIEDAMTARFISRDDIPEEIARELGETNGEIIGTLVSDLIENSLKEGAIGFSPQRYALLKRLKEFNYENIYFHPRLEGYVIYVRRMISYLYDHFGASLEKYGEDYEAMSRSPEEADRAFAGYLLKLRDFYRGESHDVILMDYISGMTDSYVLKCVRRLFLPEPLSFPK